MAYACDGAGRGVPIILIGWQLWQESSLAIRKFGFHFSSHHLGPGGGAIRRAAFHLRNAGFFAHRASDAVLEHRNGSLSDRARAASGFGNRSFH